jgi:DNA primase
VRPSESLKAWLGRTADRYHEALTPEIRSYLEGRGLDQDAVSGYRLGYVDDPDPMHEPFRGRLSIPFITPTGVVYIRFRCLEDHVCDGHGKYEGPSGEDTHLYNVQALHSADTVIGITEGELDAAVSTLAGFPAVGVPGAQNWKHVYYRLFDDFERVIVMGDGDKAGRTFTSKLQHTIAGAEAKLMPPGEDVNSFILEHGKNAFLDYVLS